MSKADIKKPVNPIRITAALFCALLAACESEHPADQWLGKWTGVEGTYLILSKTDEGYDVMIQSLDKIETFKGMPDGGGVSFMRRNQAEKIYHGDGAATGMKWLADKKDCLVVRTGEGYCRS